MCVRARVDVGSVNILFYLNFCYSKLLRILRVLFPDLTQISFITQGSHFSLPENCNDSYKQPLSMKSTFRRIQDTIGKHLMPVH